MNIRYDEAHQFKYHFGCLMGQWYNQEFIKAVSVSKVHKPALAQLFNHSPFAQQVAYDWINHDEISLDAICTANATKHKTKFHRYLGNSFADPEKGLWGISKNEIRVYLYHRQV